MVDFEESLTEKLGALFQEHVGIARAGQRGVDAACEEKSVSFIDLLWAGNLQNWHDGQL